QTANTAGSIRDGDGFLPKDASVHGTLWRYRWKGDRHVYRADDPSRDRVALYRSGRQRSSGIGLACAEYGYQSNLCTPAPIIFTVPLRQTEGLWSWLQPVTSGLRKARRSANADGRDEYRSLPLH